MTRPRLALVLKRSVLERLRDQPNDKVEGLLRRGDATVANINAAHNEHAATIHELRKALAETPFEVTRIRTFRSGFDASGFDLVVTVGGDGTLLNTSHSVGRTPILGINSSPSYSVGFFCGVRGGHDEIVPALDSACRDKLAGIVLTRMQVNLNGELVSSRVLNDALFCHQSPAATSRYILELDDVIEEQKSSGLWIGPAAGSTAAQRSAGGKVLPLTSKSIQLVVREPYTPTGKPYQLHRALIKKDQRLQVRSKSRKMRMFLDGPDRVIRVDVGDRLEFCRSQEPLKLLALNANRRTELSSS